MPLKHGSATPDEQQAETAQRMVDGIPPFSCCGRTFTTVAGWKAHKRSHEKWKTTKNATEQPNEAEVRFKCLLSRIEMAIAYLDDLPISRLNIKDPGVVDLRANLVEAARLTVEVASRRLSKLRGRHDRPEERMPVRWTPSADGPTPDPVEGYGGTKLD